MHRLITTKITSGEFTVSFDGATTGWRIINGSRGLSGRDTQNVYGIVHTDKPVKWIGTLASCKKILAFSLAKKL